MTLGNLLINEWRGFRRSPMFGANVATTLIVGLFVAYFALSFVGIAFVSRSMIETYYPDNKFLSVVFAFLLFYFLVDILTRYFLQNYASISLRPYLLMPIKKSVIVDYFLLRSLSSYFNYLPLFFVVPFFLIHMSDMDKLIQLNFTCFVLGAILFNNYLVFWINKLLQIKPWLAGVVLLLLVMLLFLGYKGILPILEWLTIIGETVLVSTWAALIPLAMAIGFYVWLRRHLSDDLNVEDDQNSVSNVSVNPSFGFHRFFGNAGYIMDLEVKLISRSKRARTYFFFGLLFIFYPYVSDVQNNDFMAICYSIMGSGMFALSYGQLMLSWNSLHFDLLQTRQISIKDVFTAKYYLLVLACLITAMLAMPFVFMQPRITIIVLVMSAYNMSFSIFMYMYLASYNSYKIDPNESGMFNYSGLGVGHYVIIIPILIIPVILFAIGSYLEGFYGGLLLVFLPSVLLLIFHKKVVDFCCNNFMKHRYQISAAFRKK